MSQYLQTSTGNPYGHRPWQTRLYTGFEDFGFLKQPQNTILREDFSIRPRIYKPPEMAGLGNVTLVTGAGRIFKPSRKGGSNTSSRMHGLGVAMYDGMNPIFDSVFRRGLPPRVVAAPIVSTAPPIAPVSQIRYAPLPIQTVGPILPGPMPIYRPPVPPIAILPPSLMPPVPSPVASGPGGTIYALPGDATSPGSPFSPPPAGQLFPTGSVPVGQDAAAAAAVAASTPASSGALATWFNSSTWISGVPNGYVAIGIAGALYLFTKKKR